MDCDSDIGYKLYIPDPTDAMAAAAGTTTSVILVMVSSASA